MHQMPEDARMKWHEQLIDYDTQFSKAVLTRLASHRSSVYELVLLLSDDCSDNESEADLRCFSRRPKIINLNTSVSGKTIEH